MRFVCPELDKRGKAWMELVEVSKENQSYLSVDGKIFPQVMSMMKRENGIERFSYLYGPEDVLKAVYRSLPYDGTSMTIAEFATSAGVTVDTNFSDSADYRWWVRNLWETRSSMWYTVFHDDGVGFYLPVRGNSQLTDFAVIAEERREGLFEDMVVSGETEVSFSVAFDPRHVVPATGNSTQKNRLRNKYLSRNRRLTIESPHDVDVLTWIAYEGEFYVILSRREMVRNGKTVYQYDAVAEMDETLSFSGADTGDLPECRLAERALAVEGGASATYYRETSNNVTSIDFEIEVLPNQTLIIDMKLVHNSPNSYVHLYETNYSTTNSDYYYVGHYARSNPSHSYEYGAEPLIGQIVSGKESNWRIIVSVSNSGELYAQSYELAKKIGGDTDIELRWHGITSDGVLTNSKIANLRFTFSAGIDAGSNFRFEILDRGY